MSLLHEIQRDLIQDNISLSPVLLKLRLLVSKLGSEELKEWVKYESEGYPNDAEVPKYRKISLTYKGTFFGVMGSQINNAPIPSAVIEELAGKKLLFYEMKESMASVENLILSNKGSELQINIPDLMLILDGKVYEGYSCNSVTAYFGVISLCEIQQIVKNKILELTIELEKRIPDITSISIGMNSNGIKQNIETVQQITQQIFQGNVGTVVASIQDSNIQNNFSDALDELQKQYLKKLDIDASNTLLTADVFKELIELAKKDITEGKITEDTRSLFEKIAEGAKNGKSIIDFAKTLFELYSNHFI